MPKSTKGFVTFNNGEVSPKFYGRTDVQQYDSSAKEITNFIPNRYGVAERTPGTHFVAETKDSSSASRLIPFIYNTNTTYLLEFGDQYIRFYTDNGSLLEANKTITGATQADPCVITIASHGYSNGDEVYISSVGGMTELNGKRYRVANVTTNTFEITDIDGNDIDSTGFTAYTSGGTAARVYEISTPYSASELWDIDYAQSFDVMYFTHPSYPVKKLSRLGATNFTFANVAFEWGPFKNVNTTSTTITPSGTTGSVTLTASGSIFTANHVGSLWKITHSGNSGYVEITAYSSGTSVTATVKSNLSGTSATEDWNEGSFSAEAGYPSACAFHEQRFFLSGTDDEPNTTWGSVSQQFENFNIQQGSSVADDDSVVYTIAKQTDRTEWLASSNDLLIGTQGGVYQLGSGSNYEALTPTTAVAKLASSYGASRVNPAFIGNTLFYAQSDDRRVNQFFYSVESFGYETTNMTAFSDHITSSGIKDLSYQQSPENVLWFVLNNGKIATLTREIQQQVIGWAHQETDGSYESVASIPNGEYNQVWVIVNRTIDGNTRRYVEYFAAPEYSTQADAFFVHSGLTYSGSATTTLSGLDHLEGEEVAILAEGAVHPNRTVTNGSITLKQSYTKVQVGLPYTSTLETLSIDAGSATGSAIGAFKKAFKTIVKFYESLGGKIGVTGNLQTIFSRNTSDPMDTPPSINSEDRIVEFPAGWNRDLSIVAVQDQPLPFNVVGVYPTIITNDR